MSIEIRRPGDTTEAHANFIGADREITIDTDKKTVVVHDGKTLGGFPLSREDLSNVNAQGWERIRQFIEYKLIGSIISAPLFSVDGFLLCDGAEISRTDYAKLFAKIGTTFGVGDDETTFNLPDYRGYFLRGLGGNSETDFATAQLDQLQGHSHNFDIRQDVYGSGDGPSITQTNGADEGLYPNSPHFHIYEPITYGNYGEVRIGTETRPINKAINFFIKY